MDPIKTQCSAIADRCVKAGLAGIDPMTIIAIAGFLLQIWSECFKANPASSGNNAAHYVSDHYDAATDKFDDRFVVSQRQATRRACRKSGQRVRQMNNDDLDIITEQSLRQIMSQDQGMVTSCMLAMGSN